MADCMQFLSENHLNGFLDGSVFKCLIRNEFWFSAHLYWRWFSMSLGQYSCLIYIYIGCSGYTCCFFYRKKIFQTSLNDILVILVSSL